MDLMKRHYLQVQRSRRERWVDEYERCGRLSDAPARPVSWRG